MGTTERREREKLRRREDILSVARTVFFDKGFRHTTIDDIARAAELSRGTVYLYFDGKEEIYATVLEEGMDTLFALTAERHDAQTDPLTQLLSAHDAFVRFHDDFPHLYNVLTLDKLQIEDALPDVLRARLSSKLNAHAAHLASILTRGMAEGVFRPMNAERGAFLQMGMAMGFMQMQDKCVLGSDAFADRTASREAMHDMVAMSVLAR